jgi:hypothetical protein
MLAQLGETPQAFDEGGSLSLSDDALSPLKQDAGASIFN